MNDYLGIYIDFDNEIKDILIRKKNISNARKFLDEYLENKEVFFSQVVPVYADNPECKIEKRFEKYHI